MKKKKPEEPHIAVLEQTKAMKTGVDWHLWWNERNISHSWEPERMWILVAACVCVWVITHVYVCLIKANPDCVSSLATKNKELLPVVCVCDSRCATKTCPCGVFVCTCVCVCQRWMFPWDLKQKLTPPGSTCAKPRWSDERTFPRNTFSRLLRHKNLKVHHNFWDSKEEGIRNNLTLSSHNLFHYIAHWHFLMWMPKVNNHKVFLWPGNARDMQPFFLWFVLMCSLHNSMIKGNLFRNMSTVVLYRIIVHGQVLTRQIAMTRLFDAWILQIL